MCNDLYMLHGASNNIKLLCYIAKAPESRVFSKNGFVHFHMILTGPEQLVELLSS